jgi:hypothetical protein
VIHHPWSHLACSTSQIQNWLRIAILLIALLYWPTK